MEITQFTITLVSTTKRNHIKTLKYRDIILINQSVGSVGCLVFNNKHTKSSYKYNKPIACIWVRIVLSDKWYRQKISLHYNDIISAYYHCLLWENIPCVSYE